MTNKELAQIYRNTAAHLDCTKLAASDIEIIRILRNRADELDPPKPQGGTVVWWRYNPKHASSPYGPWELGITAHTGDGIYAADGSIYPWDKIEWDEAHIWGDPSNA